MKFASIDFDYFPVVSFMKIILPSVKSFQWVVKAGISLCVLAGVLMNNSPICIILSKSTPKGEKSFITATLEILLLFTWIKEANQNITCLLILENSPITKHCFAYNQVTFWKSLRLLYFATQCRESLKHEDFCRIASLFSFVVVIVKFRFGSYLQMCWSWRHE